MKLPVLYTFRRCPYAMRARISIFYSKINYEHREILLKDRPEKLYDLSPKGTVPVLNLPDGKVIDESLDIMIWSIKKSKINGLLGENDNEKSKKIFSLIEKNDTTFKYHLDRFKYASRFNYGVLESHRNEAMKIILSLNNRLKNFALKSKPLFLVSAEESIADWAIWPFVRQFRIVDKAKFDQNHEIKYLRYWLNYFSTHNKYQILMKKNKPWSKYSEPIFFGK